MQRIPEWYLRLKEEVYQNLSKYIGKKVGKELCEAVERDTNKLINQWREKGLLINIPDTQIPVQRVKISFENRTVVTTFE